MAIIILFNDGLIIRGTKMDTNETQNNPDYKFHKDTYLNVLTMFKLSLAAIVITLLLLAWLVV